MSNQAILECYDAQMRIHPPKREGVTHTYANDIVRVTGHYNCVEYYRFSLAEAQQRIADEITFFSKYPGRLEWKIYEHDEPKGLASLLSQAGFTAEEAETVVAVDLNASELTLETAQFQNGKHIKIRYVRDRAGLDEMIAVASDAFAGDFSWMSNYESRLNDDALALYLAYFDDKPVGTARLEMPLNRGFATAYIGSVTPEYRGKGIYRALVSARAADAKQRGFRYMASEARETSRPILKKLGFIPLTKVQGWIKIL